MKTTDYKVLITASGIGKGLGELTKYKNKTLLNIGLKPVIAYIIESYPKNAQFVITLGHFGKQVKDYLLLAYPAGSFIFVNVDIYEGKGSSLGYSMLQAEEHLQQPFIYHASDTVVTEKISIPDINWIAGFNGESSSNYTSFNVLNGKIQKIMEKGILNPDYLHIGLVGVHDYKRFWKSLKKLYDQKTFGEELGDIHIWNDLISHGIDFKIKEFTSWHDTGNITSLKNTQENFSDGFYNLDKPKEAIFIQDNKYVIKFYFDNFIAKQRVERAKILKGLVPKITNVTDNFLTYKYVKGYLYADIANPSNFPQFLKWAQKKLWKPVKEVSNTEFKKICFDFYRNKTTTRINEFLKTRNIIDSEDIINGEKIPSVQEMFSAIDFDWLSNAEQSHFHGDFILDNIIKTSKEFKLLDWRPNFGGLLEAGDIYYDFAKLNHNLIVNHNIVVKNLFTIKIDSESITCDILRKDSLVQCQKIFFNFLKKNNHDIKKVNILTSLVWFSSSPLHYRPYDSFLFYFAKLNLWKAINNEK